MTSTRSILLEVAVDTVEDALNAQAAGADRIELCSALSLDGLTPSIGAIRAARRLVSRPLMIMIRPRAGPFFADEQDVRIMAADIEAAVEAGADGLVLAVLNPDRTLNGRACRELLRHCAGRTAVFHRAFDHLKNPLESLSELIDLGFSRILTSGGGPCAADPAALERLVRLTDAAAGRIEILPGGGIRAANVSAVLERSRFTQVHSSCRTAQHRVDPEEVKALRSALDARTGRCSGRREPPARL